MGLLSSKDEGGGHVWSTLLDDDRRYAQLNVVVTQLLNDTALLVAEQPRESVTVTVTERHTPSSTGWIAMVRVFPLPLTVPVAPLNWKV